MAAVPALALLVAAVLLAPVAPAATLALLCGYAVLAQGRNLWR